MIKISCLIWFLKVRKAGTASKISAADLQWRFKGVSPSKMLLAKLMCLAYIVVAFFLRSSTCFTEGRPDLLREAIGHSHRAQLLLEGSVPELPRKPIVTRNFPGGVPSSGSIHGPLQLIVNCHNTIVQNEANLILHHVGLTYHSSK